MVDPLEGITTYQDEIPSLRRSIPHFRDVVMFDIGAFVGTWTIAALRSGAKFVYAIDPMVQISPELGYQNKYKAVKRAIDESLSLDSFVKDENIQEVGFVKIDVEGNELKVLRSGEQTLKRFKPKLMVESHDHMLLDAQFKVHTLLTEWGFTCNQVVHHSDQPGNLATYHLYFGF